MFKADSSFLVLYTTDIQKTYEFFTALDLVIKERTEDKVVVQVGAFELHYILYSTEPHELYEYTALPGGYGHGVIFYVETSDITEAQEKIRSSGGRIRASVFDNHWGCKEFLCEDPSGYTFAVFQ